MSLHDRMTEASRSLHGPCQDFNWTDVPVPTGSNILYKADRQPPKHLIYNSNKLLSTTSHLSTQSLKGEYPKPAFISGSINKLTESTQITYT
jgi:hypothetical protein